MDSKALILSLRAARRILNAGTAATRHTDELISTIRADTDHSKTWQDKRVASANDELDGTLRGLAGELTKVTQELDKHIAAALDDVDYTDPTFQSALTAIGLMKRLMPYRMRECIPDRFAGRPELLRALRAVYEENGFSTARLDELIQPFSSISTTTLEALTETCAYADPAGGVTASWRARQSGAFALIDRLCDAFNVDITENPVRAEIDTFRAGLPDGSPEAKRVDRWLELHGPGLDDDRPGAMALGQEMLAQWSEEA